MAMRKKFLITFLIFVFLSVSAFASGKFMDVTTDHWAYQPIQAATSTGVMDGYPDGTFKPESPVTRAELAQVIYKLERRAADASDTQIINSITSVLPSVVFIQAGETVGSGVIVDKNHILTVFHVVQGAKNITITTMTGQKYPAQLDKTGVPDLALLKFDPKEQVTPVKLADMLVAGQTGIAIGHPFGLEYSISKGIVSAVDRKLGANRFIQMDTAVNMGNSGGPLIDTKGRLIGIVKGKIEIAEGIGISIRLDDIKAFLLND
jgi:S1-C subfamily serine protease